MHYELKNQCNIQSMVCRSAKLADTHFALGPKNILKCVFYANLHEFYPKFWDMWIWHGSYQPHALR